MGGNYKCYSRAGSLSSANGPLKFPSTTEIQSLVGVMTGPRKEELVNNEIRTTNLVRRQNVINDLHSI